MKGIIVKKVIGIAFGNKKESYYKNEDSYVGIPTYTKENLSETEKYLLKTKKNNVSKI
jgi:hypothetical protein